MAAAKTITEGGVRRRRKLRRRPALSAMKSRARPGATSPRATKLAASSTWTSLSRSLSSVSLERAVNQFQPWIPSVAGHCPEPRPWAVCPPPFNPGRRVGDASSQEIPRFRLERPGEKMAESPGSSTTNAPRRRRPAPFALQPLRPVRFLVRSLRERKHMHLAAPFHA